MNGTFRGTRWRLVGWFVLAVGAILAVVGTVLYLAIRHALLDGVDSALVASSQVAQVELSERGEADELSRQGYHGGRFYLVLDGRGGVIANPQQVDAQSLPPDALATTAPRVATYRMGADPVRIYARQIVQPNLGSITLVVGQSLASEQATEQMLLVLFVLGGALGLLCSFVGAWFLAERALVPIQRAFQRQQEFVADASHELRTPLTILHSATDMLERRTDEPLHANQELLDEVRQEIMRMERLTRDLLTLARSDRGELQLSLGRLNLGVLAHELVQRVRVLAQTRGIALEVHGGEAAPVVDGDPDRLQQVGLILLDNALQHTPAGGTVRISTYLDDKQGVLEVEDTGEGIPSEHLSRVFDRFHRVDTARSRSTGGAGLGLSIARSLVSAHSGRITLANRPGGGTRATAWLPLAEADPELPDEVPSQQKVRL